LTLHAESPKSSWSSFKGAVFKGIDIVKSVTSNVEKSENDDAPEPFSAKANKVMDGYQDRFFQPEDEQKEYRAERVASLLVNNKMLTPKERAMYALKATAPGIIQIDQDPEVARPNLGPGPVRFKVNTKILEQEAVERAKKRGLVPAKNEDLYSLVDAFQATVDAAPGTIRSVTNFVRSVPDRVGQTLSEVEAIPTKVQDSTTKTIQNTQKAVKGVQDFPNMVVNKVEKTKKAFVDTKESLDRTVNKVKRFVGADKPAPEPKKMVRMAPKPPIVPPPEPAMKKENEDNDDKIFERVLDVTGRLTLASADLAFSAASSLASVAVDSAKGAIAKRKKAETPPAKVRYVAPEEPKTDDTIKAQFERLQEEQRVQAIKNQQLNKESAKIEKEVADALKLAEEALRDAVDVAPEEPKKDDTKAQVELLQEEQREQAIKHQKLNKESAKIEKEVADALKSAEESLRDAVESTRTVLSATETETAQEETSPERKNKLRKVIYAVVGTLKALYFPWLGMLPGMKP
jgi:hypothetical protein